MAAQKTTANQQQKKIPRGGSGRPPLSGGGDAAKLFRWLAEARSWLSRNKVKSVLPSGAVFIGGLLVSSKFKPRDQLDYALKFALVVALIAILFGIVAVICKLLFINFNALGQIKGPPKT